jgi:Flp pilus assembly protein TadG
MKKIMTYWKNSKGITIVFVALMLVLLMMFLGMAVDIAYTYVAKNQLQVAADAAALAGAGELDDTNATNQLPARTAAWNFACKNKAAMTNVFLIANGPTDCSTPPGNLNIANDPNGDIVIGNWDPNSSVETRFLPTAATPLPTTGPRSVINAVKIVAARISDPPNPNVSNGSNRVRVFFGQVFDWAFLNARAVAIATLPPRASAYVAVGSTFCPPAGSTECPGGSAYPTVCELGTPRLLDASGGSFPDDQRFGWTSLLLPPGSTPNFISLMCTKSASDDICAGGGIWGVPGTSTATLRALESLMYNPGYDSGNKEYDVSGNLIGWWTMFPQVVESDPMSGPDPDQVLGYVLTRVRAVCSPGGTSIAEPSCVDTGAPPGTCGPSGLYPNLTIAIDRISCIPCDTVAKGLKPALVK